MAMKQDIYKDQAGEWRWRLVASNGQVVASSGEGFKRKWSAKRSLKKVLRVTEFPNPYL